MSQSNRFRIRLKRIPGIIPVGVFLITAIIVVSLTAPWLAPYNPWDYTGKPLEAPSRSHLLGTNDVGQDILSELLYGTRTSLTIGVSVGVIALSLSLLIGLSAVLKGGWLDFILMRCIDVWLAIPPLILILLISAFVKPRIWTLIGILSLFSWAGGARLFRAQGMEIKGELYVQVAEALGATDLYLARRHLLPALYPLAALAGLTQMRRAILLESALAFLGLADPGHKSWGMMIQYGLKFAPLGDYWLWWLMPPALALSATLISLALIVFGLESWFDPTLRG